jgi:hypothetical protein
MKKFKTLLKDLLESGALCLHGALFAVPFVVLLLPLFAQASGIRALFDLETPMPSCRVIGAVMPCRVPGAARRACFQRQRLAAPPATHPWRT